MTTTIHIREIRPSDKEADEMDTLGLQAFTNVAIHKLMFPRGEETRVEEHRFRSQRFRASLKSTSKRFVVAVEETVLGDGTRREVIAGWARWDTAPTAPEKKIQEESDREWE